MKINWKYRVPTAKMSKLGKSNGPCPNLGECARLTKFYDGAGQLHWNYGRDTQTIEGYFVQSWDQEMRLVIGNNQFKSVTPHLDANIRAEVIRFRLPREVAYDYEQPVSGVLWFLGNFHPSHQARVDALEELRKLYCPRRAGEGLSQYVNQ